MGMFLLLGMIILAMNQKMMKWGGGWGIMIMSIRPYKDKEGIEKKSQDGQYQVLKEKSLLLLYSKSTATTEPTHHHHHHPYSKHHRSRLRIIIIIILISTTTTTTIIAIPAAAVAAIIRSLLNSHYQNILYTTVIVAWVHILLPPPQQQRQRRKGMIRWVTWWMRRRRVGVGIGVVLRWYWGRSGRRLEGLGWELVGERLKVASSFVWSYLIALPSHLSSPLFDDFLVIRGRNAYELKSGISPYPLLFWMLRMDGFFFVFWSCDMMIWGKENGVGWGWHTLEIMFYFWKYPKFFFLGAKKVKHSFIYFIHIVRFRDFVILSILCHIFFLNKFYSSFNLRHFQAFENICFPSNSPIPSLSHCPLLIFFLF